MVFALKNKFQWQDNFKVVQLESAKRNEGRCDKCNNGSFSLALKNKKIERTCKVCDTKTIID